MPFLESFENVNQERGDEILDPTNDPVNASIGYWNLQRRHYPIYRSVFWHNIKWPNSIKFKNIYRILIPLEQFHAEVSVIEKRMKHLDQQANIFAAARIVRDEVLDIFSLFFQIYCKSSIDWSTNPAYSKFHHGTPKFASKTRIFGPFVKLETAQFVFKRAF